LTLARNAQKEFLTEVIVGKENEHFIKLLNVNKLAVNKLVLTYNVSMGTGNMGAGSKSHATLPTISGWLLVSLSGSKF